MYHWLLWRSAAQALGHVHGIRLSCIGSGYKHSLTSNFADCKNIQFTIHILSRPILSITVTETLVEAQESLWWKTEMMKVKSQRGGGLGIC